MKFRILVVLLAALTLLLLASTASAHGVSVDKLDNAGWSCMVAGPHGWTHCFPPSVGVGPAGPMMKGKAANVMVFEVDSDGHSNFLGTELLITEYHDQPCMAEGGEHYHDIANGGGVYACHHFDTAAAAGGG